MASTSDIITAGVAVAGGLIGLAALATALSPKAKTSQVIGAASTGFATNILAAVSPVTGNAPNLGYGSFGGLGLGGF